MIKDIHEQNETLFYNFIIKNLNRILPVIYTPTEGEYIQRFGHGSVLYVCKG